MIELLKDIKAGTKIFGDDIASIVNFLLLTFVYFLGVGITSIIARISGKNFLDLREKRGSYWSELNLSKRTKEEYYRQF